MTSYDRITVASRVFAVSTILGLVLLTSDIVAVQASVLLAVIAATLSAVTAITRLRQAWVAGFEAVFSGLLIGLMLPAASGLLLLPYLVVPALSAGLTAGVSCLLYVLALELSAVLLLALIPYQGQDAITLASVIGPWLAASLGVGLLGVWLRRYTNVVPSDTSYEAARRLLTQLRTVARRLSSGLDTGSLAVQLLNTVGDQLSVSRAAVFVRTSGGLLTPIAYEGPAAREELHPDTSDVRDCWTEMEPITVSRESSRDIRSVLPLRVGSRMFGVIIADCSSAPTGSVLARLMPQVDEASLRLDTALTFDEVRSLATQEERRRLAREIHDGVAQEVASLGYVIDEVRALADSEDQRRRLSELRREVTRVVGELRHSIFDLRSEVTPSAGLGSALSDYVRDVGARSRITVHLTLDEAPTRLRAEVETELLRIAQEAITNARKHSGASNLWVDCHVKPPYAHVSVRDDGNGLVESREGSYGLKIMRERAARIDAALSVSPQSTANAARGTSVVVRVGEDTQAVTDEKEDKWQLLL